MQPSGNLVIRTISDDMETIKNMFAPLMKEQSLKHIEYKVFNSVQRVESNSIEQRYNSLQGKVAEAVADDSIITVLLTYIILFSPDFCKLTEKRPVEQLQVRAKSFILFSCRAQVLHKWVCETTSRKP